MKIQKKKKKKLEHLKKGIEMVENAELGKRGLEIGILVLGVALLALTFFTAYSLFTNPEAFIDSFTEMVPELETIELAPGEEIDMEEVMGPALEMMTYVVAAILLWVMGSVGGKLTKHGVSLYKSK